MYFTLCLSQLSLLKQILTKGVILHLHSKRVLKFRLSSSFSSGSKYNNASRIHSVEEVIYLNFPLVIF